MEAKEKAIELVDKFYTADSDSPVDGGYIDMDLAKYCARIAVDEVVKTIEDGRGITGSAYCNSVISYWQGVKSEIDKL